MSPTNERIVQPLEGRRVLVTGGGRGLGAAICDDLARAGADIIVLDLDETRAQACAALVREHGGEAWGYACDVSDARAVARTLDTAISTAGGLDVLVNNAAIDVTAPVEGVDPALWQQVLQTNLVGPYLMCHAALPALRAARGQIVNIASTASKRAWPNASAYHASKWGLLGLSHALHAELRDAGIRVSAIVAGGMRTPFLLDRFPDIDVETLQPPEHVAATVRFVLTQPPGTVIPEVMVLPMRETSWP